MADDDQIPPSDPPGTPPARTFTQTEVNSIAAAARRAGEEKADRIAAELEVYKAKASTTPTAPRDASQESKVVTPSAESLAESAMTAMERKIEFLTGLAYQAGSMKIPSAVQEKVKALYQVEKPPNPTEWLSQTLALFAGAAPVATTEAKLPTPPNAPPPIAQSAPSTAVPLDRDVDILSMRPDEVHGLIRKAGGDVSRPYDPKNRAGRREIRKAFEEALRTKRVVLGSGR
jgi:hypothetical protein